MQERKRLHVTPLNPELLPAVLPQQLLAKASDISFHTIQTFPERNFAYINLPSEEADKLRKKLNVCLFRGQKMKVEEARPTRSSTRKESSRKDELSPSRTSKRSKKKTKEDGDTISAIELSKDRKVKRGWTEPESVDASEKRKSKKEKRKSKEASITGGTECLFKTKLPSAASASPGAHEKSEKGKKRKRTGHDSEILVHEYRNTTRHNKNYKTGRKTDGVKQAREYVDGKGWVDDEGSIVEQPTKRRKSGPRMAEQGSSKRETSTAVQPAFAKPNAGEGAEEDGSDATSSSGTSNSDGEGEEESEKGGGHDVSTTNVNPHTTAGLGISSTDGNEMQSVEVERLSISRSSGSPIPHVDTHPASQSTSHPSVEVFPPQDLFKRPSIAASQSQTPKKPHLEVSTSFSFFDPDDHAEAQGGTSNMLMPQTPFTQQDIRHRRQRSAAPTPDTAAVGKTFGDVWGGGKVADDDDDDEEDDEDGEGGGENDQADGKESTEKLEKSEGSKGEDAKEESEFAKFFWDQRGPNNRAWKRGRREATKEKRKQDRNERRA
ncbi:MAG: hypothetical protein OHK93_004103 [Ramalina farinacea]|uniref:Uncharacterized protein n=1 Tax=Ramalina farinacea TaxID=258253 RepID=A0AA43QIF0_9LECA|nr:hypothetical protein [Ramalina farinacea]